MAAINAGRWQCCSHGYRAWRLSIAAMGGEGGTSSHVAMVRSIFNKLEEEFEGE